MFLRVGIARDGAVILLAIEVFVISLVSLVILLRITKALRTFIPQVAPALRETHRKLSLILGGVTQAMEWIRSPFVWILGTITGIRACLESLQRSMDKGR